MHLRKQARSRELRGITWQRAGTKNRPVQKCRPLDGILQCSCLLSLIATMPFLGYYWYNVRPLARSNIERRAANRVQARGMRALHRVALHPVVPATFSLWRIVRLRLR